VRSLTRGFGDGDAFGLGKELGIKRDLAVAACTRTFLLCCPPYVHEQRKFIGAIVEERKPGPAHVEEGCNGLLLLKIETIGGQAHQTRRRCYMAKLAIWAEVQAKPGKEKEVEGFLKSAQPLAEREGGTLTWYAVQIGPGKYGIFDTFADENGREAHLTGEIAKALMAKANELFPSRRRFTRLTYWRRRGRARRRLHTARSQPCTA